MTRRWADSLEIRPEFPRPATADDGVWQVELDALWLLRNPRPRYDPPQLWHRYADLRVTLVCIPGALDTLEARLDTAAGFRHDGVS